MPPYARPGVPPNKSPYRANQVGGVDFTIGVEGSNAITVNLQLKSEKSQNLGVRGSVQLFLSDDENGDSMTATAAAGGIAAGTDGHFTSLVTGKMGIGVSESDGDLDIVITHATGAKTWYLVAILPDGGLVVSDAITFA
jgi:hypothetical protein